MYCQTILQNVTEFNEMLHYQVLNHIIDIYKVEDESHKAFRICTEFAAADRPRISMRAGCQANAQDSLVR